MPNDPLICSGFATFGAAIGSSLARSIATAAGAAAAEELRKTLLIVPGTPITSMRSLVATIADVRFVERRLESNIDGAYARDAELGLGFIYINALPKWTRRRFTMAHELGHHCLSHENKTDEDVYATGRDDAEVAANAFAAELLMPRDALEKHGTVTTIDAVAALAATFLVSGRAMLVRLKALRLAAPADIEAWEATYDVSFFDRCIAHVSSADKATASRTRFPTDYLAAVNRQLSEERITLDAAIEALDNDAEALTLLNA